MLKLIVVAVCILSAQGEGTIPDKDDFVYLGEYTPTPGKGRTSTQSSIYYVSTSASTWGDAFLACTFAFGGGQVKSSLLAVETADESTAIRTLMVGRGLEHSWVNGAFDPSSSQVRWVSNGAIVDFGNWASWAPGHPVRAADSRLIIGNFLFGGTQFGTAPGDHFKFYICEQLQD